MLRHRYVFHFSSFILSSITLNSKITLLLSTVNRMLTSTPLIAASEFYLSPLIPLSTSTSPASSSLHLIPTHLLSKLKTLGPSRARDMRASNTSLQIVSHTPVTGMTPQLCQRLNDALHGQIVTAPDRFRAMALLPKDGIEAAKELGRCVGKYRFVGGVVGIGEGEGELEEKEWDELWRAAERYRVPVALNAVFPSREKISEFAGGFQENVVGSLITNFHAYRTTSPFLILHLYLSGVFDRYPSLRLILSEFGHLIPSLLPRILAFDTTLPLDAKPSRSFLDVWQHNFYISTADVLDLQSMRMLLEKIPLDRVLFAGNYPWEKRGAGVMRELLESGIVTKEEWERIACGNAEWLFGLRVGVGGKGIAKW